MRLTRDRFAASMRPGRIVLPSIALAWLAVAPPVARAAERVSVWLPPAAELAAEDARRDEEGLPWRFALPQAVRLTPERDGRWEQPARRRASLAAGSGVAWRAVDQSGLPRLLAAAGRHAVRARGRG